MNDIGIEWLGDRALLLRLGSGIDAVLNARVHAVTRALHAAQLPGVTDIVPAYASVAVHYDPQFCIDAESALSPGEILARHTLEIALCPDSSTVGAEGWVRGRSSLSLNNERSKAPFALPSPPAAKLSGETSSILDIPVCYGGEHGPDLADVARLAGLDESEVVARHAAGDYHVAMLGFAPGFPYLLGLDPALHAPRRANPRTRVPAGSVAIGGAQTGIYPRELPGGWQIIGCTPLTLFDAWHDPPALFAPGQPVRFRVIDAKEFVKLQASNWPT